MNVAGVLHHTLAHFEGQVQSRESGITLFEAGEEVSQNRLQQLLRLRALLLFDAMQQALVRLLAMRSRGERRTDPTTDAQVRAYLWRALFNNALDLLSKDAGIPEDMPDNAPDPEEEVGVARMREELQAAQAELYSEIVPGTNSDVSAPRSLSEKY